MTELGTVENITLDVIMGGEARSGNGPCTFWTDALSLTTSYFQVLLFSLPLGGEY